MILLVDAGNTRVKWRLVGADAATPRAEGACTHDEIERLGAPLARYAPITRIVGTNVAGPAVAGHFAALAQAWGVVPEWVTPTASCAGVTNRYDDPAQLGADRWAALIGARRLHAGDCLVVSAGTATTVDLLTADGCFEGGLILPGVELMQRALASGTAQLPLTEGHFAPAPRCTADAIRSGCLQAQAGAVERMFRQIADRPDPLCLLAGGAADAFAPLLGLPLRRVDSLVLPGLQAIVSSRC
ncbi:type III pantothenate kinase [Thauera sinica]|uniref:Type III pantothenate kinase n=1 Tax=Thauera sinica TaxID=2665146 RepID=A0ABW1AU77_9RHOO|nr:type III pantothenate kinase [Thauera sp. K11]ATE58571.1 type III pantothenate kinase [Thauera sp. K11]